MKDEDAAEIDYDGLLKEMQADTRDGNAARVEAGYDAVELLGWALPPRYDAANKKLHWAKLLRFGDATEPTLNYNARVLGRRGVLVMNVIGSAAQLPEIQAALGPIMAAVDFTTGHRYRDFDPGVDDMAAYGIGGLVAGKVLAKVGLFAFILKGWKLILVAAIAAWTALKRFVFKSKDPDEEAVAGAPDAPATESAPPPFGDGAPHTTTPGDAATLV